MGWVKVYKGLGLDRVYPFPTRQQALAIHEMLDP